MSGEVLYIEKYILEFNGSMLSMLRFKVLILLSSSNNSNCVNMQKNQKKTCSTTCPANFSQFNSFTGLEFA